MDKAVKAAVVGAAALLLVIGFGCACNPPKNVNVSYTKTGGKGGGEKAQS